jgi:hypothetical protein
MILTYILSINYNEKQEINDIVSCFLLLYLLARSNISVYIRRATLSREK